MNGLLMLLLAASAPAGEPQSFKLAALKLIPKPWDKDANLSKLQEYARRAAAAGVSLVVTPEGYLEGYVGNMVCYDRQLPETSRILAIKGAQVILVPAFGPGITKINEDIMMRTRAYENSVYVAHVHRRPEIYEELLWREPEP